MIHKQTVTAGRLDAKRYWCCLKRVNRSWDCVKSRVICYTWGPILTPSEGRSEWSANTCCRATLPAKNTLVSSD